MSYGIISATMCCCRQNCGTDRFQPIYSIDNAMNRLNAGITASVGILGCLGISLLGIAGVGCSSHSVDPAYEVLVEQQHDLPPTGQLGVDDKFELRVYEEESLSGEFTIAPNGTINYPHLGRIQVSGMTCAEVEDYITQGLSDGILRSPSVSCSITEYNSKQIYLFGEIEDPGTIPYRTQLTIVEAFALAGGFTERARANNTKLTRVIDGVEMQFRIPMQEIVEGRQRNLQLLPGDVIYVPQSSY